LFTFNLFNNSLLKIFLNFKVSPIFYNYLVELVPTLDLSSKEIEEQVGFKLKTIDSNSKIPCYKLFSLWVVIEKQYGKSDVGLVIADQFTPEKAGLIGKLFMSSKNLRESVELMDNYLLIIFGNISIKYTEIDDSATLYFDINPKFLMPLSIYECYAKICYNWASEYIKPKKMVIKKIQFHGKKPKHIDFYNKNFHSAKLFFDADQNYVVLNKDAFYLKNTKYSHAGQHMALDYANYEKQKLTDEGSFSQNVLYLIYINMPFRKNSIDIISSELGISVSTLKRRLAGEGTNFKTLNSIARKNLSKPMLRDLSLSYDEIVFILGYSEYSSFFRAFKQWHNETPTSYRSRHS